MHIVVISWCLLRCGEKKSLERGAEKRSYSSLLEQQDVRRTKAFSRFLGAIAQIGNAEAHGAAAETFTQYAV